MRCHICGYEIPDNKKFCPGCGRVLTIEEQKKQAEQAKINYSDNTVVYRPAATNKPQSYSSQTNIPDIFSNDPDAPEYNDPHIYDKATADVLEYDRMFVSRKNEQKTADTYASQVKKSNDDLERTMYFNIEQENTDEAYDESDSSFEEEEKALKTKPRLNINVKMLVVCIAIIAGIAIIITGTYQIGKKIGLWSSDESTSQESDEGQTLGEKAPVVDEPQSNIAAPESDYVIGIYTLTSEQNTVFVYKGATDDRIVATIPNGTVIEITEVKGEMGKTTYGSFTGWVRMAELTYSPNDKLTEKETTTAKEPSSEADTTQRTDDETTTAPAPTTPGTYTVDLKGDGTYVNVRDTSSTDGNVVATLDEGTQVTVDTVDGSWGHIKTADGTEGWIYMVYLK